MSIMRGSLSEASAGNTNDTSISFLLLNDSRKPTGNPYEKEAAADNKESDDREDSSPLESTRLIVNFDNLTTEERDTYLKNLRLLQRDREQFGYIGEDTMGQGYDMNSDEINGDTLGNDERIGAEDEIDGEAEQDEYLSPWNPVSPSEDGASVEEEWGLAIKGIEILIALEID